LTFVYRLSAQCSTPPSGSSLPLRTRTRSESSESSEHDPDIQTEESKIFDSKRKAHYNEYYAVKLARKLMEKDEDEDGDDIIPSTTEEETSTEITNTMATE